jgi:predicted transcriptional regulator
MTISLKKVLQLAESWSEEDQEELAQIVLEIEARRHGSYQATPDELKAIDEGLAAAKRGEFASDEDVAALLAKFRP